ncbi:MAG TPA: YigZ family protein [Thermoanaerobaculia bacterium]|nr:YigZ family protein [Thermoanaerobaculia bacterium]
MSDASDARRVPAGEGRGEVREKASRFFGFACRVASPAEADAFVERLRREHHDATHVAFAFKVGAGDAAVVRASDAGEPSGTAGRPILAAIESAGMTDAAVAVVRWFGGTKLGTGGLARAYRLAAERALAAAGSETVYETVSIEVRCPHARTGAVRRLLDPPAVRLASERFEPDPVLVLEVRRSRADELERTLTEARLDFRRI